MRRTHWFTLLLVFVAVALPVSAHHGFQAEFDGNKIIYVTGILTKIDWSNPHMHLYVDAKDADGKVTSWTIEGSSPGLVIRSGTNRSDLLGNIGKTITVRACPAKNANNRGAAETVKLADGRELVVGGKRYQGGDNPTN